MKFHRFTHLERRQIIIISFSLSILRSRRNNFHIKSHHFKMCTCVSHFSFPFLYLWKRHQQNFLLSSCARRRRRRFPFSHDRCFLPFLFGSLIKARCVTNGLENFIFFSFLIARLCHLARSSWKIGSAVWLCEENKSKWHVFGVYFLLHHLFAMDCVRDSIAIRRYCVIMGEKFGR